MDMTPMIDIVFLLIIFFMTVSQISRVNEEPLELPLTKSQGTEEQDQTTVTININDNGELVISGAQRSLPDAILAVTDELAKVGNEPSLIKVLIRCSRSARSESVNELVKQLNDLGIRQVRMGTQEIQK